MIKQLRRDLDIPAEILGCCRGHDATHELRALGADDAAGIAGDDHASKSSTLPHQSEYAFMDAMIPVLNPAGVQEILDLGVFGWELSRDCGAWVAMKTIAETVDSSASVTIDPQRMPTGVDLPLHPGAERYYREAGLLK